MNTNARMSQGGSKTTATTVGRQRQKSHHPPNLNGFVFTERLGSGTYATVYKAYKKSSEQREVLAIKCIQKSSLTRTSMENLLVEIEILKQINHPHIVRMIDFQWDATYIYIIMEYCSGGDLSRFISTRRVLPEYIVRRFLQQIASALELLHNHNISHMDLKPQNILLTSEEQPVLKLADFGFAQYFDSSVSTSLKGSPLYMAPEIIMLREYNAKVDLWSIGVILYECLFGRAPFASKTFVELENKIKSEKPIEIPSYPKVTEECSALLYSLLQRSPDDRISFDDFFCHPFVDLEHKPSPDCIKKATSIVTEAVEKDKEGKKEEAARLYSDAVEYFVPAIYYESDKRRKAALRAKVKEYCTRAEQLRNPTDLTEAATNHCQPSEQQISIEKLSQNKPEISDALQALSSARQKESEESFQEAMKLYEQSLEILIPMSTEITDPQLRKLLHNEIQTNLNRAESLREKLKNEAQPSSEEEPDTSKRREPRYQVIVDDEESTKKCIVQ